MKLVANPTYWDTARGPRLQEVVFRNDLTPAEALAAVCDRDGEVDIVTEVATADAARVEASTHAKLVTIDAARSIAGVINRYAVGLSLADKQVRLALNYAIDRDKLVREAMHGHAAPLAGLAPPCTTGYLLRLSPYPHSPRKALELWKAAGGATRPIRLAATRHYAAVAERAAADIREALEVEVEVTILDEGAERIARGELAVKARPPEWDVFILMQSLQSIDAPPMELHRAFADESGEYRAGPVDAKFQELYADFVSHTAPPAQVKAAGKLDQYVYDEALALFLCAPHALYAVNRHVTFTPYRTTFELAECEVDKDHWSRRGDG